MTKVQETHTTKPKSKSPAAVAGSSEPMGSSRTRNGLKRLDYNEISEEISESDTDNASGKPIAKRSRQKTSQTASDFQMNNTSSRNTEMAHRLKLIEKLLNDMMKHSDAWPFLKPVSRREVYYCSLCLIFSFVCIKIKLIYFYFLTQIIY
jgi:hypothetical protein